MLDSGASTNVTTLEVMNELGLTISRPYRNVQDGLKRSTGLRGH
jgi:hypothetical protein